MQQQEQGEGSCSVMAAICGDDDGLEEGEIAAAEEEEAEQQPEEQETSRSRKRKPLLPADQEQEEEDDLSNKRRCVVLLAPGGGGAAAAATITDDDNSSSKPPKPRRRPVVVKRSELERMMKRDEEDEKGGGVQQQRQKEAEVVVVDDDGKSNVEMRVDHHGDDEDNDNDLDDWGNDDSMTTTVGPGDIFVGRRPVHGGGVHARRYGCVNLDVSSVSSQMLPLVDDDGEKVEYGGVGAGGRGNKAPVLRNLSPLVPLRNLSPLVLEVEVEVVTGMCRAEVVEVSTTTARGEELWQQARLGGSGENTNVEVRKIKVEHLWHGRQVFPQLGHAVLTTEVQSAASTEDLKSVQYVVNHDVWDRYRDTVYYGDGSTRAALETANWEKDKSEESRSIGGLWSGCNGEQVLGLAEARATIFCGTLQREAVGTDAWRALKQRYDSLKSKSDKAGSAGGLMLIDFNGPPLDRFPHGVRITRAFLTRALRSRKRPFCHAYVYAAMLLGIDLTALLSEVKQDGKEQSRRISPPRSPRSASLPRASPLKKPTESHPPLPPSSSRPARHVKASGGNKLLIEIDGDLPMDG